MHDALDIFLLEPLETPAKAAAFRALLKENPDLADALAHWQEVLADVRTDVAAWPTRHLLVLYALDVSGHTATLSDVDRALLEPAAASLEAALEAHPALQAIVRDIQAQADAFEAAWQLYQPETTSADAASRADTMLSEAPEAPAAETHQHDPARLRDRPARPRPERPLQRSLHRWVWRVGATAAVVAFVAVLSTLFLREQTEITLATGTTEVRELTLADGSTVRLLPKSTLTYADGDAFNRRLRLEGKAYFTVIPGATPFAVTTETALTTVLGTTFGIASTADVTEVTLVSGRVTVAPRSAPSQMVVLAPGEASRVVRNALPTAPAPVDLARSLAWTGQFVFRSTPLATMAEQLTLHYQVPVQLDPALPADSINGTFEHTEALSEILHQVAASIGVDVQPMAAGDTDSCRAGEGARMGVWTR